MSDAASTPLVSIAVLNWNGLENTKACLASLKELNYSNYEIVVVDNGSTDGSKEFLRTLDNIVYVDNPHNRGFAGGHVDAFKRARGDFIFLLNNDAVVAPDIINAALETFAGDDAVAVVGGRVYRWNDDAPAFNRANEYHSYHTISPTTGEALPKGADTGRLEETCTVSGSGVFIRRTAIDDVGYLFEPFFAYYEETDLFARMRRQGLKVVYDPRVQIWHRDGASTAGRRAMFYRLMFRNRLLFAVRNFDSPFLSSMLRDYCRNSLRTLLRRVTRVGRADERLRGEFRAVFNAIGWIPFLMAERRRYRRSGHFGYSAALLQQNGTRMTVAINCWDGAAGIAETLAALAERPSTTEILVIAGPATAEHVVQGYAGVRVEVVKCKLGRRPENYALALARGDYITFLQPGDTPDAKSFADLLAACRHHRATAAYLSESGRRVSYSSVRRAVPRRRIALVERGVLMAIGGFPDEKDDTLAHHVLILSLLADGLRVRAVRDVRAGALPSGASHVSVSAAMSEALSRRHARHTLAARMAASARRHLRNAVGRSHWTALLALVARFALSDSTSRGRILWRMALAALRLNRAGVSAQLQAMRIALAGDTHAHQAVANYLTVHDVKDTPVFIISRDRLKPLQELVTWLERVGLRRIVIVDNDSTYPPLVSYLAALPYEVLHLRRNGGHTSPWDSGAVALLAAEQFYIVTDPDVIPDGGCGLDAVQRFYDLLARYPAMAKVGFGLRIDDLPDHYALKESVIQWEAPFWTSELEVGAYEAPVDTTFALYRANIGYSLGPAIRTGPPHVARHLPWYTDSRNLSREDTYYREHASKNINSWDADELPDRYRRELDRASDAMAPS